MKTTGGNSCGLLVCMDSSMDLSNSNPFEVFNHPAFGFVRVVLKDGEPWFVGKDVAEVLGYQNQNRDIVRHIDEDDRIMLEAQYQNGIKLGQRGGWIINESGLYSLMLRSKLPQAREFKRWVTLTLKTKLWVNKTVTHLLLM